MREKMDPTDRRKYVHYTLHPDDIMFIIDSAATLGVSQSQFVSAMIRFTKALGPLKNEGITPKA